MDFFAEPADPDGILQELSSHSLSNPFCTPEFFAAMQRCGYESWVLGLREGGHLLGACGAFVKSGRLNRVLEIVSLTEAGRETPFWSGLLRFCSKYYVTQIEVGSYGSPEIALPRLPGEIERKNRQEFVLDLRVDNLRERFSPSHKRNIRKAERAGLRVARTRSQTALAEHLRMKQCSRERRCSRGEEVGEGGTVQEASALLESNAGELYQVIRDGVVFSSVLVLRSRKGACTHSSGTSKEGMKTGASHFLRAEIASRLKTEGVEVFNLGGALEDSGLAQFKAGFGCKVIPLLHVGCRVGPAWRRKLSTVARMARQDRRALAGMFVGRIFHWLIYAASTDDVAVPESSPDLVFRQLTEVDLRGLRSEAPEFRQSNLERLDCFGRSYAYGVFFEGRIAHISWLLPAAIVRLERPLVFPLQETEAEITGVETLPAFRGRGILQFAIQNLLPVARQRGIRRIFAKVANTNEASQAGFRKTAFKRVGSALILTPPAMPQCKLVWRLYR
jgi:ribosomal protein S18 acetylase RimI-like enzyme